ncbi:MAG: helix-turn-helix transcriptional regulator [Ruminococcus sp.]|nr:helix-turn-helix transcriptional regulator [Ruminococcus sp.]
MAKEFQLFPDIRLVLDDKPVPVGENELMICCCTGGICEYHIGNGYWYLADDTVLALSSGLKYKFFSSKDFRGAFLIITPGTDIIDLSDIFGISAVLNDIQLNDTLIYQADSRIKSILSAVITGAEKSLTSILRLKIIELFMLLNENRPDRKSSKKAMQVGEFVCRNVSEHFTISQLSEMFDVNQTKLKSNFRSTYGCGIYSYIKKRKIFRAVELLTTSDVKIIDAAEEVGYSNASKFASAFRSVTGVTPKHFQMEHKAFISSGNIV